MNIEEYKRRMARLRELEKENPTPRAPIDEGWPRWQIKKEDAAKLKYVNREESK